ncbi:MAG TPA: hypothetical protein DCQ31_15365 [Bacteroidales bacterium]|nr:hypothetical protein [Bacteroidales bacterium]
MTIIGLELDFDIRTFLFVYGLVALCIFYFLKTFILFELKPSAFIAIIISSLFFTYISTASIIIYETNEAYAKLKSIPIENLTQFYQTKDIQTIPSNRRHAWIGIRYKEIGIVSENRIGKINAVGWRGNSVFAYYDFNEKDYIESYH